MWEMKWGTSVKFLTEVWEETGDQPKTLAERPILHKVWHWPYAVFAAVSDSRNYTAGGPAAIPFSEIYLYAMSLGYAPHEVEELYREVHAIDHIWLAEVREAQEAKLKQPKKPA